MKILFVCTGNTCRSPMAQYLFNAKAKNLGIAIEASSAGLAAFPGDSASENALTVMAEKGIDMSGHRSRRLTVYDLEQSDLIICMSESHKAALPQSKKCIAVPGGIPDPFGADLDAYRICADKLESFVDRLIDELCKVKIVEAKADDAPAIAELEKECFSKPWSENAILQELELDTSRFFCAEQCGTICGYIGMNIIVDECYITNVAVSAKYRKKGIGTMLIDAAQKAAKESRCRFVSLEVRKSNIAAIRLYEKCGFEICGERKNFYCEPTENAYIMTKTYC